MQSDAPHCDIAIIGQGLAGSCLAWQLYFRGAKPVIIDAGEAVTSSKIAAGLITPVGGLRFTESWNVATFLPAARQFYRQVEQTTAVPFFKDRTAVRFLQNDKDKNTWAERCDRPEIKQHLLTPLPSLPSGLKLSPHGYFAMATARLGTRAFLAATRAFFAARGQYREERLAVADIAVTASGHYLPLADALVAKRVVFCQGFTLAPPKAFAWVPFKAARGDILTVRMPNHGLAGMDFHAGIWIAPQDADHVLLGSTYDWKNLTNTPDPAAAVQLMEKLQHWLGRSGTVVHHAAAVRPIIQESRGMLGQSPAIPGLYYFNGLGSKGSLHAPQLASYLADYLIEGKPIPAEHDLQENT